MKRVTLILLIVLTSTLGAWAIPPADTLETDKTLIVKGDRAYPPYEFINESGEPDGFNVELAREILNRIGRPYRIELDDWSHAFDQFTKGEADCMTGLIYSNKRAGEILFSSTHSLIWYQAVSRKGEFEIQDIDQLKGLKILVPKGEIIIDMLEDAGVAQNLIYVPNMEQGLRMLSEGTGDIAITADDVARLIIKQDKLKNLRISDIGIPPMEYCIVVSHDENLLLQINRAMLAMKLDGSFDEIRDHWFKQERMTRYWTIFYVSLASLLTLLALSYGFSLYLRRRVKRAEEQVRLENSRYRALFANTVVGLEYYDREGILVEINAADCEIYGVPDKERMIASRVSLYDNPTTQHLFPDRQIKPYSGIISYDLRKTHRAPYFDISKRDEILYIDARYFPLYDAHGEIESIICTSVNVTERYKAELESRESRKQLQMLLEADELITWTYDLQLKKVVIDRGRASQNIGDDSDSYIQQIYPADVPRISEAVRAITQGKADHATCVARYKTTSGEYNYHRVVMTPFEENGVLTKIIGSSKNIHNEHLQEQAVKELSATLDLALEAGDTTVWKYDLSTGLFSTIRGRYISSPTIRWEEYFEITHPDDREKQRELFEALTSGTIEKGSSVQRYKNSRGEYHTYRNFYIIQKEDDKVVSIIGTRENISKEIEQQQTLQDTLGKLKYTLLGVNAAFFEFDVKAQLFKAYNEPLNNFDENVLLGFDDYAKVSHPDDTEKMAQCAEIIKNGINQSISIELRQKSLESDEWQIVGLNIFPFTLDENGRVVKYVGIRNDITKLTNISNKLYKTDTEKQTILQNLPVAIAIYAADGRQEYLNEEGFVLFGVTDREAHAARHISIFDDPILTDDIKSSIHKGEDVDKILEYSLTVPNQQGYFASERNDSIYLDAKVRYIRDNQGAVTAIIIIMSDITENRIYEQKLQESISKTQYAIQSAGIAFWDFDVARNTFLTINDPIAGYDQTRRISIEEYTQSIHPDDIETMSHFTELMLAQANTPYSADIRFKYPDGKWHYCTISGVPFNHDANGRVLRYVGFRRDNTKIIQLNSEVKEYADRIRYIIESSNIYTWDFDLRTGIIRITSSNKKVPTEMTFEEYKKHIPAEEQAQFKIDMEQLLHSKAPSFSHNRKMLIDLNDPSTMEYSIVSGIIQRNAQGEIIGCSGLRRDITSLIRIQERLEQEKIKAETADRLKSAFLANMSHEIRTPLNAIVGFSELLQSTDDAEEKAEYINIIKQNNAMLLRLIGDILDLSKIESGLIELQPEPFDLSTVFEDTYTALKQKCTNPEVIFSHRNPYHRCIVELDKNRLVQIGTNFITNAIKYTAKGEIEMGYEYVDQGVRIYVRDTGIGIAEAKQKRVFQRFEKLDSFAQGTGLGLAICKAIVERMEGRIGFESVEGKGSTFWAWIPCKAEIIMEETSNQPVVDSIPTPSPETANPSQESAGNSILIAEDNDSNFLLVKAILKRYELTRACNGSEAVNLAQKNRYLAILMDMKMPVMDGLEATRQIRQFDTTTPIVALTANAFDSDKTAAAQAGCNDFIAKPLNKAELEQLLESYAK